ncbi:sensor histidine kinase [Streptococcus sobrinus]|uniref:histidine kinase n=1 Tax=Streptococcus sobrinus TaxID=1310 RepID=A0ABN5LJI4_9STRE|nr:sensor histidine kinase [Streptococcus sobrinus]AWN21218.1 sensor histidine kinase [Streptococcus sobrinus]SQG14014.1 histidine kinase [Streptococcus sobrinus]
MFRPFERTDILYLKGLVFLTFPILGIFYSVFPFWSIWLTLGFALAYLGLIYLTDRHKILLGLFWFYSLFYIIFTSFSFTESMVWFFFFNANILVWRFRTKLVSYQMISFLLAMLLIIIVGFNRVQDVSGRIMVIILPIFVLAMMAVYRNMQISEEAQEKIQQQNRYINLLSAENERNRIGRDLHDSLGHTFALLSLKLDLASKQLDQGQTQAVKEQLRELSDITHSSMADVRRLVNELKYRSLTEELADLENILSLTNIAFQMDNQLEKEVLTQEVQSHLTMILRELVTNMVKHAQAKHCRISLSRSQSELILEVSDDGVGFAQLTGRELHSIRERLTKLGGSVTIISPRQPTQIEVRLAL